MKRTVITALISLAIPLICLAQQTDTQSGVTPGKSPVMVTRTFDVLPSLIEQAAYASMSDGEPNGLPLKTCFNILGVEWPEGSSIKFISVTGKLIVKNTEENLRKCEVILSTWNVLPYQIEIEVKFIEYQPADIEVLVKQGGATQQALINLWQKGKARLIHAPKVVTVSGERGSAKSVKQVIYPTRLAMASTVGSGTNDMNVMTNSNAVVPSGFETREVGVMLKVTPEVNIEGVINMTISSEVVEEPTWKTYKGTFSGSDGKQQQVEIEEPFFFTQAFSTYVSVKNGETVMPSGGMMNEKNDKMVYCFVTARRLNMEGKPIITQRDLSEESRK
jgi:type II secretory pathway component GspD/PulD (secretin)